MGGSISSRCITRAAPRHAGPAGREPGLYLVSAGLRAVAAVPIPARADLPGAPRTFCREVRLCTHIRPPMLAWPALPLDPAKEARDRGHIDMSMYIFR